MTTNDQNEKKSPVIIKQYRNRLAVVRQAHVYAQKNDIPRAVEGYVQYLGCLAAYYEIKENELKPSIFNMEKEMSEIMMISQVYWGLAKAYDRNRKLHRESIRCLEQFVVFTKGFKFQFLNSELIRKFLKKKMAYNPDAFQRAYEQIKVDTKKCYVVTYCFHEDHKVTCILRDFRNIITGNIVGDYFIKIYYSYSPKTVDFLEKHPFAGKPLRYILSPILILFSKVIQKFIIKKCSF